jgi:hypothetical protein
MHGIVAIFARNTKVYKIFKFCKAIFSAFYNISQPNFAILLILVCSLKLVHNAWELSILLIDKYTVDETI